MPRLAPPLQFAALAAVAALASGAIAPAAHAQLMASERASVAQVVDGTRIALDYSRPRARGRRGIFGRVVKLGETWTPGANDATTMAVSRDVSVNGVPVAKGTYSVWMVPAAGDWQVVLDPDTTLFHTAHPPARPEQIRFAAAPRRSDFTEVLTWSFPEVGTTGATLLLQWDTVAVPLRIGVPRSYETRVDAAVGAAVRGVYTLRFTPPPPGGPGEGEPLPDSVRFSLRHEGGELHATMDPPMFTSEPGYERWMLLPRGAGYYAMGRMQDGELVEIVNFLALQFTHEAGRVTGFELRLPNDMLAARGTRLP